MRLVIFAVTTNQPVAMMSNGLPKSEYEQARRQSAQFAVASDTVSILQSINVPLALLNEQRRIIFANQALLCLLECSEQSELLGRQPGEILACETALSTGDCGRGDVCRQCGAFHALQKVSFSQQGAESEWRVTCQNRGRPQIRDFRISAKPLDLVGERFVLLTLTDLSHHKKRQILEQIFYHDILNLVGGIRGFAEFLKDFSPSDPPKIYQKIYGTANQVMDQIASQRALSMAESGDVPVQFETLEIFALLKELVESFRYHPVAVGKNILLKPVSPGVHVQADRLLIKRILGNLMLNALEATGAGESVTVGAMHGRGRIEFWVHNEQTIPLEVQPLVFRGMYSSKGNGRGLGTYSVRLLTGILGGEVRFSSCQDRGTTFWVDLPLVSAGGAQG